MPRFLAVRFITAALFLAILPIVRTEAQGTDSKTSKPLDSIHDTMNNSFTGELVWVTTDSKPTETDVADDIKALQASKPIPWTASDNKKGIEALVSNLLSTDQSKSGPSSCGLHGSDDIYPVLINPAQVYVLHLVLWSKSLTVDGPFHMRSSGWYAYKLVDRHGALEFTGLDGAGDQFIYAKHSALIIGISGFDMAYSKEQLKNFEDTYSAAVTQGTPQNLQDLGLLLSALGGFASSKTASLGPEAILPIPYVVTVGCQHGTPKLPFTLTITNGTAIKSDNGAPEGPKPQPPAGTIGCAKPDNGTPCTSTHTFASTEVGWWDVSIGITTPGTRETKYSFSSGAVQTSVTRHTDLYALVDIFPWAKEHPKDSIYPHINLGLPVTSQSLYRPYFGLAESLTGWTGLQRKLSLPVGVNFFAGVTFMKTKYLIDNPTTQQDFNTNLKSTRDWKAIFGIEVPISAMASKLGGKGGSAKGSGKS